MAGSDRGYYSSSAFGVFSPLALIYAVFSNLWVRTFGNNAVKELPATTDEISTSATSEERCRKKERKVAIVTGSNTGIGYETAQALVLQFGWEVVLACRSMDKAKAAAHAINKQKSGFPGGKAVVLGVPLDLSNFDSVGRYSQEVCDVYSSRSIDVLINNAGRNSSGISGSLDLLFSANFLGHFSLTCHLIHVMTPKSGIIVNLSSVMHHFSGVEPKSASYWTRMATYTAYPKPEVYSASKLAALIFSAEINRRYGNRIRSVAVNPGACASDIWRDFPAWMVKAFKCVYLTPRQGSIPVVAAAMAFETLPDDAVYVQPYWLPMQSAHRPPHPIFEMLGPFQGYNPTVARLPSDEQDSQDMWSISEHLSGVCFPEQL